MQSVIESPDRDLPSLHLMPSLLLDLKPPPNAQPHTAPPKFKPNFSKIVFLLRHGSGNKIMDATEKHTKGLSSPEKSLRLRLSEHKRTRLAMQEGDRKKVKELVSLLENLWKSVSMGATTVPQGTMQLMRAHLGEGGTQCFDEIFALLGIAGASEILVAQQFWYCWTEFLAHSLDEDLVKDEDRSMLDNFLHSEESIDDDLSQHGMESAEAGVEGQKKIPKIEISIKDRIKAYFFESNRISEQFCEIRLANMEREWIKVAGSLSEPLTVYNINQFLTFVLVDHPHVITTYNCKEFCDYFDKKLEAQGIHMCMCMYVPARVCVSI